MISTRFPRFVTTALVFIGLNVQASEANGCTVVLPWAEEPIGISVRAGIHGPFSEEDWGKTGHRVSGAIAEMLLKPAARKAIAELLDGESLASASTFADEIKSDRSYSKYSPWHYVNYPLDSSYANSPKSEYGDVVRGTEYCLSVLRNPGSTREEKAFHLRLLIHFVGDLHQPLHAGRAEDKGGNDIQVRWFNQGSNLHRVWDSNMLESYGMSYSEIAEELMRPADRKRLKGERNKWMKGTVADWVDESHQIVKQIYSSAEVGEKLSYRYSYDYNELMFEQLKKAGFRIAYLLNDVFG